MFPITGHSHPITWLHSLTWPMCLVSPAVKLWQLGYKQGSAPSTVLTYVDTHKTYTVLLCMAALPCGPHGVQECEGCESVPWGLQHYLLTLLITPPSHVQSRCVMTSTFQCALLTSHTLHRSPCKRSTVGHKVAQHLCRALGNATLLRSATKRSTNRPRGHSTPLLVPKAGQE